MSDSFEAQKNQRAFLYTAAVVTAMLLIAIFWTWQIPDPPKPPVADQFEINLGNLGEGFGQVQPLIKGEKAPGDEPAEAPTKAVTPPPPPPTPNDNTQADDNNKDAEAAEVNKNEKKPVNKPAPAIKPVETPPVKNPAPVVAPAPKPQKPKIAGYNGPKSGTGNGANEDNGYRYQGNKPGGKGDAGDPNGNPDSYGNKPGGSVGGAPKVFGDRKIIRYYSFTAELPKAVIYAIVKVSPEGKGTFAGFGKNSTSTAQAYANEIIRRLPTVQFDPADHVSTVTVQFNFTVN